MLKHHWKWGLGAALVSLMALGVAGLDRPPSKQLAVATPIARSAPTITSGPTFMDVDLASQVEQIKIDEYLAAEHQRQLDEFYAGVQAELDRLAEMARLQKASAPRAPAPTVERAVVTDGDVWWRLALCECGGNPGCNTGNGFYGTFQFMLGTWQSVGGTGYPHEHSYEEQKLRAQILQARSGWGQWPACARSLGLL